MGSNSNDSNSDDNEYIMVDTTPLSFDFEEETTLCDDEDYDYCDDAISEGIQSECLNLTEDMILEEAEKPSIQYILDEAHRSASQLVSMDTEPADTENGGAAVPGILESSASDASGFSASAPGQNTTKVDIPMEITTQERPKEETPIQTESDGPKPTTTVKTKTTLTLTLSNATALMASNKSDPAESDAQVGGRMSNKKRRKKMKLMKKAAAAAMAAAALSEASSGAVVKHSTPPSPSSSRTSSGKSSPKASSSRYNKKRVANIAVACATETLSSYKAELAGSSKKVR
ncbi:expressed unknown protein [Seminavis robusta]|uniref:Uncharacterized protein n=1 Tax=Seminavis robusta TaxID=568900 RepID=A0A9N8H4X9_9STRA|nr:expressed unknown protein [Seminavis robusta]|eukprot:Sro97_g050200.1 n/a (288) ;mRNA; r:111482-112345